MLHAQIIFYGTKIYISNIIIITQSSLHVAFSNIENRKMQICREYGPHRKITNKQPNCITDKRCTRCNVQLDLLRAVDCAWIVFYVEFGSRCSQRVSEFETNFKNNNNNKKPSLQQTKKSVFFLFWIDHNIVSAILYTQKHKKNLNS